MIVLSFTPRQGFCFCNLLNRGNYISNPKIYDMKSFNEEQFRELAGKDGEVVISIYTPTSKQSTDSYQTDKTHFKNKLKEIGWELQTLRHLEEEQIKSLLQPAYDLLDNPEFWQNNDKMLAYFIMDGTAEYLRLPAPITEPLHLVGKRPFVLPLIPQLNNDGDFYLLHLNTEKIQLFKGSRNAFEELELDEEEIPLSYAKEEEANDEFQSVRKRQGSLGSGGDFAAHGEGPGEERKQLVQNYVHRLANKLDKKLGKNPLPLYLAGLDYLLPMFRQASKYSLLQKKYMGTLNGKSNAEIHKKAWELAEDYFLEEKNKRKEEFGFRASRNLAISKDPEKLIKAALTGGVDTLLVNKRHKHLWGSYNDDGFEVTFDEGPSGDNHCLIDRAALSVINSGGRVFMLSHEEMPDQALIAGTLRYEVQ